MPTGRLLAMLAARAIALAACGSSSKPSSSGSADTQALKYADCMRANGTPNVPDPSSNGALPNPTLPAFRAAEKACERLQPVGMHSGGPAAPTAAELRAALAFARSMRAHGFRQFPDPLTAYGRGFTLARGEYFPPIGTRGTEVRSPAFIEAAKACGVQLPTGPPQPTSDKQLARIQVTPAAVSAA